ncbi:MAG: NADH-quinone oxidoreductase subunit J [bacterium]|nr:NADH-quinone oxidoreductase subunit J [bacterium]
MGDNGSIETIRIAPAGNGEAYALPRDKWPAEMAVKNIEGLGFNLLRDHPGTIEIAGVILLMAMLGAVVLSRKQVQLDEDAKLRQARTLAGPQAESVADAEGAGA